MPDDGKLKFGEVPPGVKVLGGTYVIDGDDFLFVHEDQVTLELKTISCTCLIHMSASACQHMLAVKH